MVETIDNTSKVCDESLLLGRRPWYRNGRLAYELGRIASSWIGIFVLSRSDEPCVCIHGPAIDTAEQRRNQAIPLNIAKGPGEHSLKDRARFLDIARGSALECAAIQDVLVGTKSIKVQDDTAMRAILHRIVAMRTRMAMKFDGVAELVAAYDAEIDCDNEHRYAEHKHEAQTEETPEPWGASADWKWLIDKRGPNSLIMDVMLLMPGVMIFPLIAKTGNCGRLSRYC